MAWLKMGWITTKHHIWVIGVELSNTYLFRQVPSILVHFLSYEIVIGDGPGPELDNFPCSYLLLQF